MDVSIAGNEWGVYAAASASLRTADPAEWLGSLMGIGRAGQAAKTGNLFFDLRDIGGEVLSPKLTGALTSVLTQAGLGRCVVLVAGAPGARSLLDAVRRSGEQGGLRILVTDGRDRPAIAAAYQWILHGREPADALRTSGGGTVLPFPKAEAKTDGRRDDTRLAVRRVS